MFEQAMSMWASFGAAAGGPKPVMPAMTPMPGSPEAARADAAKSGKPTEAPRDELSDLKAQLSAMQQKIEKLSQTR